MIILNLKNMNIKVIKSLTGYYNILEMAEKQGEPEDSY